MGCGPRPPAAASPQQTGDDAGAIVTEPTGETEEMSAGLVFRSVGYRGVALPDVPFDPRSGLIPNAKGRVLDPARGTPLAGHYATGWIKRGPTSARD